jgi:hypothetical protein
MAAGDGNGGAFNLNVQFQNEHARTRWLVCLLSLLSLSPIVEHTMRGLTPPAWVLLPLYVRCRNAEGSALRRAFFQNAKEELLNPKYGLFGSRDENATFEPNPKSRPVFLRMCECLGLNVWLRSLFTLTALAFYLYELVHSQPLTY